MVDWGFFPEVNLVLAIIISLVKLAMHLNYTIYLFPIPYHLTPNPDLNR
jgi:hypothetical protein